MTPGCPRHRASHRGSAAWALAALLATASAGPVLGAQGIQSTPYFPVKGGVAIVEPDLYVLVRSAFNELRVRNETWHGASRATPQVVYVMDGKLIEDPSREPGFDLSRCVLIAFQPDRVYLHSFAKGEGGYYLRQDP